MTETSAELGAKLEAVVMPELHLIVRADRVSGRVVYEGQEFAVDALATTDAERMQAVKALLRCMRGTVRMIAIGRWPITEDVPPGVPR